MTKFPVVERLRNIMGNARREDMRPYEATAADAAERILELEAALRLVDDDVRHHLRNGYEAAGETIPAAMIRPRAIKAVRDALGLSKPQT
jgi:hypothetical protein